MLLKGEIIIKIMKDKESYSPREVAKMCVTYAKICRNPIDDAYLKEYRAMPTNVRDNLPLGRLEEELHSVRGMKR
jgi:hypothetical protein